MKKMLMTAVAVVSALGFTGVANAARFNPENATTYWNGTSIQVKKDIELTCDMSATVETTAYNPSPNGPNQAFITAANLTDGLCELVNFVDFPYEVTVHTHSGGVVSKVQLNNVKVNTLFSSCGPGSIVADWSDGPPASITFPVGSTLNPGGCTIAGTLVQTGGPALTITP